MAGLGRRLNSALSAHFPEKRLFIQSGHATRYLRLTPLTQLSLGSLALASAAWMAVATSTVVIDLLPAASDASQTQVLQRAYQTRLDELAGERDERAAEAVSAQKRFQVAMGQIGRQQTAILDSVEERRELATALDLMRGRLQEAVAQRDTVSATNDRLVAQMSEVNETLAQNGTAGGDLDDTLRTISGALADAVVARDEASADREDLTRQLASLELQMSVNSHRQDEMVDQLEQAVAMSFGPLEKMFGKTDLDVDSLIASVRSGYSGQGGGPVSQTVSTRSFESDETNTRFDKLMIDLDRMNLLRVAAAKIPYATPLHAGFRLSSPFGGRNDPKGAGHRFHAGVDLAAPRGTAIYATADGVVVAAGRERGYGNVVKIRHVFGFETVYAHQSRIRVKVGQQVSRGDRIGDIGSTGRSTGNHVHYEVRLNGQPINPMTFLEAAKDVY